MTDAAEVWVVDDDESMRWVLERAMRGAGLEVQSFAGTAPVVDALSRRRPDIIMTDIRMPGDSGLVLLERLQERFPELPVIIMTAHSDLDSAVSSYQGGAFEYLPKPFDIDTAVELVRKAVGTRRDQAPLTKPVMPALIGSAPAMQSVFRTIGRLSRSSIAVLITGESGTGKELVARALHEHSPRADRPFVALNTAAIPAELLESELFGHERGAFTGATAQRVGRFEQADGGALFLDEIGDMSPELQTRLLRVLAEGEFYRVGGLQAVRVDVRVITATHRDLAAAVAAGTFREDLYHRLNVIRIDIPPLRERRQDIPALLDHYLIEAGRELGVAAKTLTDAARERLTSYDWPGNVRQLVNVCRRVTVESPAREIGAGDLPNELTRTEQSGEDWTALLARWADRELAAGAATLAKRAQPALERTLIRRALARTGGHRQQAARLLGWGRNTLTRKIAELGLGEEDEST